jgi:hypothetical protein
VPGAATLWLPLRHAKHAWLACAALFVVYAATMARDLSLYDSAELALAAVVLGLGHPPGQPLHTLLGFLLSKLPVPELIGVGLASAMPGALAVIPATSLAQILAGEGIDPRVERAVPWLIAVLGLHASLWEPATRVEVYALAAFFAVWAVARLAKPVRSDRDVLASALALGLAACANPMVALCAGLAVAPRIVADVARRALPRRVIALALLGGVVALLPYAYVPLVALRDDVLVWGAPRDATSLWHFFTLRDYVANQQLTLPMWISHMLAFWPHASQRGSLAVIVLGSMGHILLGHRSATGRWAAPVMLLLVVSVISFNVTWNLDVPDYDGYVAPAHWLMVAGVAALFAHAAGLGRKTSALLIACFLVVTAVLSPPAVTARTRSRDRLARALAEGVLREAPPNAIVIALVDHYSAPLLYVQEVERQRPDAIVLCHGLASSSWHWERLYKLHPALKPFALRGPGGRDARIARFLAANSDRVVRIESAELASRIGRRACAGGLYLRSGDECDRPRDPKETAAAVSLIASTLGTLGNGSPSAAGALALAAADTGVSLWRVGEPRVAYRMLLAGVPSTLAPGAAEDFQGLERAPALAVQLPPWRRNAALGDPARNVFIAAMIAQSAGRTDLATELLRYAAGADLPEAVDLVSANR